ncbi:hypothetical protein AXG93_3954s1110 [Marchantia polymorpha subsp. ruderalis]|uniref:Uncharacterized protein n=1 Tax=Marchantia polymorpha subsp. ruderalis TaxID=1480154 RepID=A0A176VM79_MARPO|nr:hypothetical protein AXG93_3954s1110 [Marchantia polymorpha subsp. ruderalis]
MESAFGRRPSYHRRSHFQRCNNWAFSKDDKSQFEFVKGQSRTACVGSANLRACVNFYRGMGLLTKSEEKQFSKERKVLTIEFGKDTDKEDNVQAEEPPRRTRRGLVHLDVVSICEQLDKRPAKRRKIVDNSGEDQRPESRMIETQVTQIKMPKRRARPKKKANHKMVVSESLESSVAKSEAAASTIDEDGREEPNLRI